MQEQVLRVSNIGKKYEIINNKENKDTFVAVLLDSIKSSFNNKKKEKGEFWALKDITFNVNKGERIGIIGHNGAGKSTLLKVFSRITVPTEGEIEVKGRIASLLEVGTGFHMELTGRENIYLNGSILGMSKEEIDSKFDDIVDFSEVRNFLDIPVKRYSSGMFVKLAFAVASHLDPDILIVDEVLAVGDMKFQEKCLGKMEDVASGGRTVLYVSHSMRTIQQLCTRVIVMDKGKIIYDGNVDDGIKIYMNNFKEMTAFNDFSTLERVNGLGEKVKLNSIKLTNGEENTLRDEKNISLNIRVKAFSDIESLFMRMTILYADKTPVGTMISNKLTSLKSGEEKEISVTNDMSHLAPGKYLVKVVLYTQNEVGIFYNYDVVEEGFSFEVVDGKGDKLNWENKWWGHIKLPEIKLME